MWKLLARFGTILALTSPMLDHAFAADRQWRAASQTAEFAVRAFRVPGTDVDLALGSSVLDQGTSKIDPKVLIAIATWLSRNFDVPLIAELPTIEFLAPEAIGLLKYGGNEGAHAAAADVVAVYLDRTRTIYLPAGWTGGSPTELSILVHEMVHHVQNVGGLKFGCAEEREKLAYHAQREWLSLFDRDLFSDFNIDPFTLLVRTQCGF
jgi:hypothetical protein